MDTTGSLERMVFALCLRVLRHRQDAEDACQEALLKIARRGPGEIDPARLAAWIHQVALRTAIDHHRANVRRKAREDRVAPSHAAEVESTLPVAEALAGLPEDERTLLVEHFFGRKTLRALADERGCSEPAVWKRVEKGKDRLRKVLMAAAPGAVVAMEGFLEAAPTSWTPWRVAVAAAVPAVVVAGLALFGLARRHETDLPARADFRSAKTSAADPVLPGEEATAPPPAAAAREAEAPAAIPPYPYQLPPPHWPEPKRAAWLMIERTRLDFGAENILFHEIVANLSTQSRIPMRLAPDIPVPTNPVTLKVKDLILRNTLKLLVSQYGLDYGLSPDGTLWVRTVEELRADPDPRFESILSVRSGLDHAIRTMDEGTRGAAPDPLWTGLRSKQLDVPQGEYGLVQLVDRLREESGLNFQVRIDPLASSPEAARRHTEALERYLALERRSLTPGVESGPLKLEMRRLHLEMEQQVPRRPFAGGLKTLEAHLEELSRAWNVGWVPRDGTFLIAEQDKAAEEMARAREEQRTQAAAAARLNQAVVDLPLSIFQLAEALSRDARVKVVPSEKAWAALIQPSGGTWEAILEELTAQGFRWLLQNDTVYIDR